MFVFGCAMGAQMLISQSQHANMAQAECCDVGIGISDAGLIMTHDLPYIVGGVNFFISILLLGTALFASILSVQFTNSLLENYYRSVREKYGGFRLFNIFTLLFSQGLIHPKIY